MTADKFKNLLSTFLFTIVEDEKKWEKDNCPPYETPEDKWVNFSSKDRLRAIWKQKNRLKFSDFNKILMLAFFKKHGLQL